MRLIPNTERNKNILCNLFLIFFGVFMLLLLFFASKSYAATPKFKLHIIRMDNAKGVNYSINYPVVIDYDLDGDQDIIYMTKEGELYIFENLQIP